MFRPWNKLSAAEDEAVVSTNQGKGCVNYEFLYEVDFVICGHNTHGRKEWRQTKAGIGDEILLARRERWREYL
jgi:hypothetical protein